MKLKNKIISLIISLSFCLVALFNAIYFSDNNIKTHETIMNKNEIDYMSLLDEFDEKELVVGDTNIKLQATQYLDSSFFEEIDNMSISNNKNFGSISYKIDYDGLKNVFVLEITTIDLSGNEYTEELVGVPFINENGKTDAVFNDDGELILLSELQEDELENCGFFSKIKKGLKKASKVMARAAVVSSIVAVVAVAVATPVGGLALATGGMIGGGSTGLFTAIAIASTYTALVSGTYATLAEAGAKVGEIEEERENTGGSDFASDKKEDENVKSIPTTNDHLEGKTHPETGVPYERKTVENDKGEEVSGVFPKFDSSFTAQLPEDKLKASDKEQEKECNKQLKEAVEKNPELKNKFTEEQQKQIENSQKPKGYTWHHNEEKGKMELVDEEIHANSGHTGGRNIWGGGTACRKSGC